MSNWCCLLFGCVSDWYSHIHLSSKGYNFYGLFLNSPLCTDSTHLTRETMLNKPFTKLSLTRLNTDYSLDLMTCHKWGLSHASWRRQGSYNHTQELIEMCQRCVPFFLCVHTVPLLLLAAAGCVPWARWHFAHRENCSEFLWSSKSLKLLLNAIQLQSAYFFALLLQLLHFPHGNAHGLHSGFNLNPSVLEL